MTMSILHRITGIALYFGVLLVAWWLSAAAFSEHAFATAQWFFGSWIGILILVGYTWALMHHMMGGLRHLVWDLGIGLEKHTASKIGWASLVASGALTAIVWVIGLSLRGGF